MGRYRTLGKNIIYVTIGTFGAKFISFIMLPLYTSWLSVDNYGLVDILTVYATLLSSLLSLSLYESIFVFPVNESKKNQSIYFSTGLWSIVIMGITGFVCFYTYKIFANNETRSNTFFGHLDLLFLLYITTTIQNYFQQFCRGIDRMRTFCYSGILYTCLTALFSFVFIPKHGVIGYVISTVLANILTVLFTTIFERLYQYIIIDKWDRAFFFRMIQYSMPIIPHTMMWWILSAINRPIIDSNLGLVGVGIFAVSNKFPTLLSQVTSIFNSSWQVSVLHDYGTKDFDVFFKRIGDVTFQLVSILTALLCVFSPLIVSICLDSKFFEASLYIPILSLSVLFQFVSSYFGPIFSATKQSKYYLYSSIGGAIISVIFNLILIPLLGLYGAAVATLASQFIIAVMRVYYSRKFVKSSFDNKTILSLLLLLICVISMTFDVTYIAYASTICLILFTYFSNRLIIKRMAMKYINRL